MRTLIMGFAVLICAAVGTAGIAPAFAQSGYDRPGGDYTSSPVTNGDPAVCATRCEHDKNCRSWSFSYPQVSGGPAVCRLKREVMPRVKSSCCVSGVRGAGVIEPRARRARIFDRSGRRRLPVLRNAARRQSQGLRRGVSGRIALPRLDLSAGGLWHLDRALLPQGRDQAAAPPALLHFGGGEIAPRWSALDAGLHAAHWLKSQRGNAPTHKELGSQPVIGCCPNARESPLMPEPILWEQWKLQVQ